MTTTSTRFLLFTAKHRSLTDQRPSARDHSILPEELATQSVRLKEEQLRREEEKVRDSNLLGVLF